MLKIKCIKEIAIMFKARDYLNKNCLSHFYHTYIFHFIYISFAALKCGVMRPIVTYFPCFYTEKNYSVNHILDTFSSYRTYIQTLNIIPLNSLYYYRIGLLMNKLSNGLLPDALYELYIKTNKKHHYPTRNCDKYSNKY